MFIQFRNFFHFFNLNKLSKNFLKPYTRDNQNIIDNFKPILKITDEERKEAELLLKKNKIDLSKKIVCLNVRDSFFK